MSFNKYSKTAVAATPVSQCHARDDDGSSSNSSSNTWQSLLSSRNRSRMMGRVKTAPLPQRMSLWQEEDGEDDGDDTDTVEAVVSRSISRPNDENSRNTGPFRGGLGRKDLPMPQRDIPTKFGHPSPIKVKHRTSIRTDSTPERPRLTTINLNRDYAGDLERQDHGHDSRSRSKSSLSKHSTSSSTLKAESSLTADCRSKSTGPSSRSTEAKSRSVESGPRSTCPNSRSISNHSSSYGRWTAKSSSKPVADPRPSKVTEPMRSRSEIQPGSKSNPDSVSSSTNIKPKLTHSDPARVPSGHHEPSPLDDRPKVEVNAKDKNCLVINNKRYTIISKIGKGGSSEVFSVLEDNGSKLRAVKRVDLSDVTPGEAAAFRNEVQLLERLRGERRIIRLLDNEERSNELLVVMEHGERDLSSLLKETAGSGSGLTSAKVRFYWEEMLEAVSVVHREAVVHSDLKPANFVVVGGTLKLIDFGIASAVVDNKTHITKDNIIGTFSFMSPEAIQDCNSGSGSAFKVGFKSDVWSLGCILYNMVYRRMPFDEFKHPVQKLQAIIDPSHKIAFPRDPASLRDQDPLVVDVLQKCLVRDPTVRASIDELLHHPYLKNTDSASKNSNASKPNLAVDQLLTAISSLTPNSRKKVVENLTSSSNA